MTMDVRAQAESVASTGDLGQVLRGLRERLARRGSSLTYRQIAARTGISSGAVGIYLTGSRLPSQERFVSLVEALGADATERAALSSAWHRLAAAAAIAASWPEHAAAPAALPAPPAGFTGRSTHLVRLDELVDIETRPARLAAITGMPGVGKTALALHWAHRVAPLFADGQIFVDLHAHSPGTPLSVMDTLGVLLSALGADVDELRDVTARSLRYQTLLRGRSVLVVLDNVGSVDQLTYLLPPSPGVAVVTSRDQLINVDEIAQVSRVELAGLAESEMLELLRLLVGPRVDEEPDAVRALAARCAYLPLALRIAAEHAAARPHSSLAELVAELEEDARGLEEFDVPGDPRADLSSVFSWSLRRLPSPLGRAFRLLSLNPGFDIDRYGLAALAGVDPVAAGELASGLVAAHLLERRSEDRYAMHDLLRAYAAACAQRDLDVGERQAAVTGLLDYYLGAATVAADAVFPTDGEPRSFGRPAPAAEVHLPHLAARDPALMWLTAERANIVAACVHSAHNGWPAHAIAIARQAWAFLEQAHAEDVIAVAAAALAAADQLGARADFRDRARLLTDLAWAYYRLGDLKHAAAHAADSVAVSRDAGDGESSIRGMTVLAVARGAQGRHREVLAIFEQIVDLSRAHGPLAQAKALINLGETNLILERYEASADCYREVERIAAAAQLRPHIAEAHRGMATSLAMLGRGAQAVPIAEQAVEAMREHGHPVRLVITLAVLAHARMGCGQAEQAIDHLVEAIQLCEGIAGTYQAAQVYNALGEAHRLLDDHPSARDSHREAFELAGRAGARDERARALVGLGDAHAALGDPSSARECWQEAWDEYAEMGLPAAARVEARLRAHPAQRAR